jgi:hypothetical protein
LFPGLPILCAVGTEVGVSEGTSLGLSDELGIGDNEGLGDGIGEKEGQKVYDGDKVDSCVGMTEGSSKGKSLGATLASRNRSLLSSPERLPSVHIAASSSVATALGRECEDRVPVDPSVSGVFLVADCCVYSLFFLCGRVKLSFGSGHESSPSLLPLVFTAPSSLIQTHKTSSTESNFRPDKQGSGIGCLTIIVTSVQYDNLRSSSRQQKVLFQ